MSLITHLSNHFVLLFSLHHQFTLIESVRHGLLHIDVLTQRHGQHSDGEVAMVGSTDTDSIDITPHLVEHLSEILKARNVRIHFQDGLRLLGAHIYITKSHNVTQSCFGKSLDNLFTTVTDTHTGQVYFFIGT